EVVGVDPAPIPVGEGRDESAPVGGAGRRRRTRARPGRRVQQKRQDLHTVPAGGAEDVVRPSPVEDATLWLDQGPRALEPDEAHIELRDQLQLPADESGAVFDAVTAGGPAPPAAGVRAGVAPGTHARLDADPARPDRRDGGLRAV